MISLIKYEFKATARIFLPIYAILLVTGFVNGLMLQNNIRMSTGIGILVLFALVIAVMVLTLVITVQRFYNALLGAEGYLMFTLPVSSTSLIFSKLIAAGTWSLLSGVAVALSFALLGITDIRDILDTLIYMIQRMNPIFVNNLGLYMVEGLSYAFLTTLAGVLMIYASIALGHLVGRRRGLAAFGAYIVLMIVGSVFNSAVGQIFNNIDALSDLFWSNSTLYFHINILYLAVMALVRGVVFFVITKYILTHNLNLE